MRWWKFSKLVVVFNNIMCQTINLFILNLYSAACQLYLNKTGRKKKSDLAGPHNWLPVRYNSIIRLIEIEA